MPPKSATEVAFAALTPPPAAAVLVDVEDVGGEQAAIPTAARAATDNAAYLIEVLLTRGTFQP